MAIYGINFNGTRIPPAIKRKFAMVVRIPCRACGGLGYHRRETADGHEEREPCRECREPGRRGGRYAAVLNGVGQSPEERDAMLITATNGHRRLHVVERQTAAGPWYGIYVY